MEGYVETVARDENCLFRSFNLFAVFKTIQNSGVSGYDIVQCFGYLISSDHLLYRVTPLKTPFGLLIPLLQSQSHVTTITHNYFLRCYPFTQL
jgi:hypothetical protein